MKKSRSIVLMSVAVSFSAVAVACTGYSSPDAGYTVASGAGGSSGMTTSGAGGTTAPGGAGGASGTTPTNTGGSSGPLPGDVLNNAGHPVVSAHSTVRVIVGGYKGPLYQICVGDSVPGPNSCKGTPHDIMATADGYADAASQDTFCVGGACTISKIYDQSGQGNDLAPSPAGQMKPTPNNPANAADLKISINGHPAYGILIKPGMGYRAGCNGCATPIAKGTAKGDEPETEYMVTSTHDTVNLCCFDYGNAETTSNDDGNGTMEAVYFGNGVVWGTGSGTGPWAMADLENGVFPGWENNYWDNISTNTSLLQEFISDIIVGDTADKNGGKGRFAVYGGDATTGTVATMYDGIRPERPGYNPMQKQGAIILGTGGDNSAFGGGRFYEGIMASGAATIDTVNALQASIVAAGYGR